MYNHLNNETSPYLLQHAQNPVDWYPWCEEAFEKAKKEDKPIFLSIGYSTCHWCHVMAQESFENTQIAEKLNNSFISIKVDREERPDIDSVYMSVCQAFTGSGGWPMSIFMTWDKKPFFAGTYFPPRSDRGMPGFLELLTVVENAWKNGRDSLVDTADKLIKALNSSEDAANRVSDDISHRAYDILCKDFDAEYGGFGKAPKFPMAHNLIFLMLYGVQEKEEFAVEMVEKTLMQMQRGGIFDQLGGGFSRYSTDKYFLVPHFEKMLYDNAWLIIAYSAAYHVTENKEYLETAKRIVGYLMRTMMCKDNGFYSAQDADCDGEEGKYYTFSFDEIIEVLGDERGNEFARAFDITEEGNFNGKNIPNLLKSVSSAGDFEYELNKLLYYRTGRERIHTDEKILTSWNAMTIAALSILYRVSKEEEYLTAAIRAQQFIEKHLQDGGELYTSFCSGKRSSKGFIGDYAYEIAALIELYNSTLEHGYLEKAENLCKLTIRKFFDREKGGFRLCESSELFMDPKETYDGAFPSANSIMAYNFVRLYQLTERDEYKLYAEEQFTFLLSRASKQPAAHIMTVTAKMLYDTPPKHATLVLKEKNDIQTARQHLSLLSNVTVRLPDDEYPLINGRATYYVCHDNTCLPPTNTPEL